VICSSCGTENKPGRRFCVECGSPLAAACPSCGSAIEPGEKFCGSCGTALGGAALGGTALSGPPAVAGAASTAPVAERRLVSVLFADLVGFTPFAEERDAEDVRDTLTRYFELVSSVMERYGGTVEKFIGDAVMAVWGAPVAHEDDAERAVRAALDLVDAVHTLGPSIQARAGVLTGEAATSIGATNQGMVAGDLVNTASRLQSAASPGTVLVGEATQRAASRAIAFEAAGEQTLKGKASPVPAWRAVRVVSERGGRNRSETLEAPFVGRDEEFRLLKDLFHATGREQRTRLVSVIGPAGIGKSRLAWEFLKYIDGLVETVWWHRGRSPAYGEGITFWALGEMVRGRCGLAEADDEATTRAKVREILAEHVPDPDEQRWIEGALLALLGIGSVPSSDQLFAAWRTFFERLSATGTVVLAFEDLHWADGGTLDFVDHLLEWSRGHPILVITLARPELAEKRPDWGAGKRHFTSVYLEPLSESAMRDLLAGLVPGLPEPATRAIVARADGIPLYAVETVRMLVAEGRLREQAGVYVPVDDLTELAVPESLTALIGSRLDSLDPADRALLQDAAVLGQSFSVEALAAISGVEPPALEPRLRAMVRRELLGVEADPRSPERGQYTFLQALTRDVAYRTLARKDRKTRHLAAARFFEQHGSDELAGVLAGHYLSAHEQAADGPEADALAAQARVALRGAAERAASLGSHDQAVAFVEQALTVTSDPAERAELLERAGISATKAAQYTRGQGFFRQALELNRQRGDRQATARATALLGRALLDAFDRDVALELLSTAATEYADLASDPVVVALHCQLARAYIQNEEPRKALEVIEPVLESAEQENLVETLALALSVRGSALGLLARPYEGAADLGASEELARAHGLEDIRMGVLLNRGVMRMDIDIRDALHDAREALALARRAGNRGRLLDCLSNLGYFAFLAGDWDGALTELDGQLAEELEEVHRIWFMGNSIVVHACRGDDVRDSLTQLHRLIAGRDRLGTPGDDADANAALAQGRLREAAGAWRRIAEREAGNAPEGLYRAARAALWDGDVEGARADLAAIDATRRHGVVVELQRAAIRAGLAASDGRTAEAIAQYRDALRGWRETGMAWDQALTGMDMAILLDPTNPDVMAGAAEAREILSRLGARPFLARLDAAMAEQAPVAEVEPSTPA
jgi:class 3 adenylate cyclase/predicted ATPase